MSSYLLANEARRKLYRLIDQVADSHEPAVIKGKRNEAVMIAKEDWEDIQETLFVAADKQFSESLLKNAAIDISECSESLED